MITKIKRFFYREPDVILGSLDDPYMLRWWVIPRNRYFNIYLHKFMRSDDDRALHDHPWASMSFILSGFYIEEVPVDHDKWVNEGDRRTVKHLRRKWRPYFRGAEAIHRVELISEYWSGSCHKHNSRGEKPVWTLFITGPWRRSWGFWCPFGFRHWSEFLEEGREPGDKTSVVGKGCGE